MSSEERSGDGWCQRSPLLITSRQEAGQGTGRQQGTLANAFVQPCVAAVGLGIGSACARAGRGQEMGSCSRCAVRLVQAGTRDGEREPSEWHAVYSPGSRRGDLAVG